MGTRTEWNFTKAHNQQEKNQTDALCDGRKPLFVGPANRMFVLVAHKTETSTYTTRL